jgi:copper resistance protein C
MRVEPAVDIFRRLLKRHVSRRPGWFPGRRDSFLAGCRGVTLSLAGSRWLHAVAFAALVTGFIFALPVAAVAHTELVSSSPADRATVTTVPTEVQLTFSEEPGAEFSKVAVLDAARGHHEVGAATTAGRVVTQRVDALSPGIHTISYRVTSPDGHPTTGTVTFTVAAQPAPVSEQSTSADAASGATATATSASRASASRASAESGEDSGGLSGWAWVGIGLALAAGIVGVPLALLRRPRGAG